jgi:hypothetical protein
MDRTACTEPQCLYKGALYLYLYSDCSILIADIFPVRLRKRHITVGNVPNLLHVSGERLGHVWRRDAFRHIRDV